MGRQFPRTIEGIHPQNYGNVSHGTVTLLKATENSINTPYVELGLQVGTDNVRKAALRPAFRVTPPG